MATTDLPTVVSDAGPPIHLDELGCLDLLREFGRIVVPSEVWREVARHRPNITLGDLPTAEIVNVSAEPSMRLASYRDSLDLDSGEVAAIALMEAIQGRLLLCDDAAARLAAESLGFAVRGTIGILIRSIRVGMRSRNQVLSLLQELPQRSSLHISRQLLAKVLAECE